MRKSKRALQKSNGPKRSEIQEALKLGYLLAEKCELKKSEESFLKALKQAKQAGDLRATVEALCSLFWLAGEALNELAIRQCEKELDRLMAQHPKNVFSMVWYCKGAIARHQKETKLAQRHFHRYLRLVRTEPHTHSSAQFLTQEEMIARGWAALTIVLVQRGHLGRAQWLALELLRRYESKELRAVNSLLYLIMGNISEQKGALDEAWKWYQKAHAGCLGGHHWYYHLYVLLAYARLARVEQNYSKAYWYLDLVDKAAPSAEFGLLRRMMATERSRLEQDALDLLIDSRQGVVKTRESGKISLRKQYILLNILEALSTAHHREGDDSSRGLSKAEIIEMVWKEPYRPAAHDNKLYYNINRLRKLIEPDVKNPHYVLNWKEGYRLAPGLKVQWVGHPVHHGENRGSKNEQKS